MKKINKAYTLAEVVVTMLIIAIIVGISLRIAKVKLDSIVSLNYYAAYSSLKTVVSEMLSDFNPDADKGYVFAPWAAFAATDNEEMIEEFLYCSATAVGGTNGTYPCTGGTWQHDSSGNCICVPSEDPELEPDDSEDEGSSTPSVLPGATLPDYNIPLDLCNPRPACPCGQKLNITVCACQVANCPDGEEWNCNTGECVPIQRTIPRTGEKFCDLFVAYSNTRADAAECEGSQIAEETTDFSDETADITLRNGMLLYNLSQADAQQLTPLSGIEQGVSYGLPGEANYIPNANEYGYIVYVDIDGGTNSNSVLWEDVFPFYVTLSGKVIPAFPDDDDLQAGGNNKLHLQASARKEMVVNGRLNTVWLIKSGTYRDAACVSGYLDGTVYCDDGPALDADCSQNEVDCKVKIVKPFKFF